jgi:hypothetical protein
MTWLSASGVQIELDPLLMTIFLVGLSEWTVAAYDTDSTAMDDEWKSIAMLIVMIDVGRSGLTTTKVRAQAPPINETALPTQHFALINILQPLQQPSHQHFCCLSPILPDFRFQDTSKTQAARGCNAFPLPPSGFR